MFMLQKILTRFRKNRLQEQPQAVPCPGLFDHPAVAAMDLRELADLPPVKRDLPPVKRER